jgi:DNA-binding response OmpR family regulator
MLPDVRLLVLTGRQDPSNGIVSSLEYLGHAVDSGALHEGSVSGLADADVVVVDATTDLRAATAACRAVALHELRVPLLAVVPDAALAALKATWGFDDWVVPNASPAELETRLRLVGERARRGDEARGTAVGDLVVDEDSYQVRLRGEPLDLTFKEFELVKTLAAHPNRVFTRELLLQEVWGYDYFGGSRTVDVHVRRLRAKLGPEHEALIVTVRGVGYKLVPLADRIRRNHDGRG